MNDSKHYGPLDYLFGEENLYVKVLFIEPPKEIWFVMGEYLPPPYGIIQLAAYLEREVKDAQIEILDCNAQQV